MITFRTIDRENFQAVIEMKVHKDQLGFMEDNLYSIAEWAFEKEFVAKAIYEDETPVGFVLYYLVQDSPDYVFLHRFMVDKTKQGHGIGKRALIAALDLFKKEYPTIGCVELMHYPDNVIGASLYEHLGFKSTGELRPSEPCRCEIGTDNENRTYEIVRRYYY